MFRTQLVQHSFLSFRKFLVHSLFCCFTQSTHSKWEVLDWWWNQRDTGRNSSDLKQSIILASNWLYW